MTTTHDELTQLGASGLPLPGHPDDAFIECFPVRSSHEHVITFETDEFTSLCEKTRQPDFGTIVVRYVPRERCLESKSMKLFLGSYRNVPMFYETLVHDIADRLFQACEPKWLEVTGTMKPRGGIGLQVQTHRGESD